MYFKRCKNSDYFADGINKRWPLLETFIFVILRLNRLEFMIIRGLLSTELINSNQDNMLKTRFRVFLLPGILLMAFLMLTTAGCGWVRPSSQRKVEKKQEQAQKQADNEYDKAREGHIKKQNKETRKMMKRTKKKAESVNKYKKRNTFFLFRKNCY